MPTVAHVVKQLVDEQPFLSESLRRGIISHAGLAEELQPEIERILGRNVTFSAVNMAIRRLADRIQKREVERMRFDEDADITVRSHLAEVVVPRHERIRDLYGLVDPKQGDFLTVTQGLFETMIITNEKHVDRIRKLLPDTTNVLTGLASVTVHIPREASDTPGMFYLITRELAWQGLNIVDVVSTYTEFTCIVSDRDASRAFEILKTLVKKHS